MAENGKGRSARRWNKKEEKVKIGSDDDYNKATDVELMRRR
jgi:hypothetical protein